MRKGLLALCAGVVITATGSAAHADTTELDSWPLGTVVETVYVYTVPALQQTATDVVNYATSYADEGGQEPFSTQGPDGKWHDGCTVEIDEPSSHLICADGFSEES